MVYEKTPSRSHSLTADCPDAVGGEGIKFWLFARKAELERRRSVAVIW
jgi:hypothetical protein